MTIGRAIEATSSACSGHSAVTATPGGARAVFSRSGRSHFIGRRLGWGSRQAFSESALYKRYLESPVVSMVNGQNALARRRSAAAPCARQSCVRRWKRSAAAGDGDELVAIAAADVLLGRDGARDLVTLDLAEGHHFGEGL